MCMHLMILIGYAYHHSLSSFYPTSFLAIYRNSMMFCAVVPYPLPMVKGGAAFQICCLVTPIQLVWSCWLDMGFLLSWGSPHHGGKKSHGHDDWMIWLSLANPQSEIPYDFPWTSDPLSFPLEKPMAFPQLREFPLGQIPSFCQPHLGKHRQFRTPLPSKAPGHRLGTGHDVRHPQVLQQARQQLFGILERPERPERPGHQWNPGGWFGQTRRSCYLVGGWPTTLSKIWVRQLGWWHSQYPKIIKPCSKKPSSFFWGMGWWILNRLLQWRWLPICVRWFGSISND